MQTRILDARADPCGSVRAAVEILRMGCLVAIPSETVYGLAGDALLPETVAKIFEAKQRPYFDPLIVHIASDGWLGRLVRAGSVEASLAAKLIERFWPGPLTVLLPKASLVPEIVTAGSREVAIRMPDHPIFAEVLRRLGRPLAAPSANRFGKVSPTRSEHVLEELKGKIPLILDAGPTAVGVESTIVRPIEDRIEILRPGAITEEMLGEVAPTNEPVTTGEISAPGQSLSHYAPEKQVFLFDQEDQADHSRNAALICWGPLHDAGRFFEVRSLSENCDPLEAAQRLFQLMREMDRLETVQQIFIERVPEKGLGKAIMNRIRRALG
jgi:L-threonylcarbamoyladenylate synthase